MQIELKRLQARVGITFIFVTHDQEEALVMSDRVAVVNQGRIEQIGTAADVYHKPATAFVADFLGQANLLEAKLLSRGSEDAELMVASGWRLHVRAAALPPGESVGFVVIRPENIRLAAERSQGLNCFSARVREQVFRGATRQLHLETEFGHLTALIGGPAFQDGQHVFGRVDAQDLVVLPAKGLQAG